MIGLDHNRHGRKHEGSLASRLLWFAGYWLAGLAAVGTLAYAIRAVLL